MPQRTMIWKGVFPAATTQFTEALAVDLDATRAGFDRLIAAGATHGLGPQLY